MTHPQPDLTIVIEPQKLTIYCPAGITVAALDRIIPELMRIRATLTRPRHLEGDDQ